ncbi:DCD (Development and Cell Death) domain-like protein [Quillaja saponaria]|nr:DCD (Development and Cell Death) domain-like protein [Quillaja saponaria]
MILFLFEYEKRKLYGVFEAISDGDINIDPHAYASSGRQYPAQVKFKTIWHCSPLSEHEFRDAIEDNYFHNQKFNFGLSKNQIQRLLWLFSFRKKVSKNEFSVAGCHCWLSSADLNVTCRQSETILCDDGYDPDSPGYIYPMSSGTSHMSISRYESGSRSHNDLGSQTVTLQEETENLHISSEDCSADLGDFIPLYSPDGSDPAEEGVIFSELGCSRNKEVKFSTFDGHRDSSISEPYGNGSPFHRIIESSFAALPLSDTVDCHLGDESNQLKQLQIKGLYSDSPNKRPSVFSRLNFASKDKLQENEKCTSVNKPKLEIMREKQESHVLEISQLEISKGKKKNKEAKFIISERKDFEKVDKSVNKCLEILASKDDLQEKAIDDLSMSEILENLQKRHANCWEMYRKERKTEVCEVQKKTSVFSRLTTKSDAVSLDGGKMIGRAKSCVRKGKDRSRVDKCLKTLQRSNGHWKTMVRENENLMWKSGYDESSSFKMERIDYTYQGNRRDSENVCMKEPSCLRFNQNENGGEECRDDVKRNCLSDNQCKSRLRKALFGSQSCSVKSIICESSCPIPISSQESTLSKENDGSGEEPVKSDRIDEESGLFRTKESLAISTRFRDGSGEIDRSLIDKELNLGEPLVTAFCSSSVITKPLKTYKRRRLSSCS